MAVTAAIGATVGKVAMAWRAAVDGALSLVDRVEELAGGRAEGRGAVAMAGREVALAVEVAGAASRAAAKAEEVEAALEASKALETAQVDVAVRVVILAVWVVSLVKVTAAVKVEVTEEVDLVVEAMVTAVEVVARMGCMVELEGEGIDTCMSCLEPGNHPSMAWIHKPPKLVHQMF